MSEQQQPADPNETSTAPPSTPESPLTEAQQEQGGESQPAGLTENKQADDKTEAAAKQFQEDQAKRAEDPNVVVARAANPDIGGESF